MVYSVFVLEENDMAAKQNIQMDHILAALDQAFRQSPMDKSSRAIVLLAFGDNLKGCKNFDAIEFYNRANALSSYNSIL